jgi:hypothetical protein
MSMVNSVGWKIADWTRIKQIKAGRLSFFKSFLNGKSEIA